MCARKIRAAFTTLGCKVNQYETGRLAERFKEAGYDIVPFDGEADVYVVNTCTVTNIADRKSRKMLRRARRANGKALIVAMGCLATADADALRDGGCADLVIGNDDKPKAFEIITGYMKDNGMETALSAPRDNGTGGAYGGRVRAYIKVQDGCSQYCAYCKIPYVRGSLKSKSASDARKEAAALAKNGCKEVVLTGIHLSSYGADAAGRGNFERLSGRPLARLISEIDGVEGIERIRLGSLEPRIITGEFVKSISSAKSLCPHFHLSLQSGSDTVLSRMRRKYTTEEYRAAVGLLREYFDMPAITADVIVGFPGETAEEFEESLSFVKETGFSALHVFKYSKRDGTAAASMEGQVAEDVKDERAEIMGREAKSLSERYLKKFIGRGEGCLVEEAADIDGKMYYSGHNERYAKLVFECQDGDGRLINRIVPVVPEKVRGGYLISRVLRGC